MGRRGKEREGDGGKGRQIDSALDDFPAFAEADVPVVAVPKPTGRFANQGTTFYNYN